MIGTTLVEIGNSITALASDSGEYYLFCGRTGDRPVPAEHNRFDDRSAARSAARATEQYRSTLPRYDPRVPYYDLIVCRDTGPITEAGRRDRRPQDDDPEALSELTLDDRSATVERQGRVELCHRVAGAVFETLSGDGYDTIERAVVDAYSGLAETVDGPDERRLLERVSAELDDRLDASEQADMLTGVATLLGPRDATDEPLDATLSHRQIRGLICGVARSPWSVDLDGGAQSVVVQISEYALSPREGRPPVLPLVVELYRRQPAQPPTVVRVAEREDGRCCTFGLAATAGPAGLVSAPIDSKV